FYLINRTLNAKSIFPDETHLLFVHDFSGRDTSKLSEAIYNSEIFKSVQKLFGENILIDLNYKLNNGCYMDMNDVYFGPHLVKTSHLSLKIFNPFILSDAEIYTTLNKYDSENRSKKLTIHALMYKLNKFTTNII